MYNFRLLMPIFSDIIKLRKLRSEPMNIYKDCPTVSKDNLTFRLLEQSDSESLFECYHDKNAVELMNDDNCDFGFFSESLDKMAETVWYWIDFYKKQFFVRFALVDNNTNKAVGTVEGFNAEIGVLRIDIKPEYEREDCISEILSFAEENFYEYFGNEYLVTKAIPKAEQRISALQSHGWEFVGDYKGYPNYYRKKISK